MDHDTYRIAVLLAEQGHRSESSSPLPDVMTLRYDRKSRADLFIYDILHLLQLLLRHARRNGVKSKRRRSCIHYRNLPAPHEYPDTVRSAFCSKMGCAVVSCGSRSLLLVDLQSQPASPTCEHAADNLADMTDSAALQLDGILYFKDTAVRIADHTGIRNLSAAGRIERSLLREDRTFLTIRQCLYYIRIRGKNRNLRIAAVLIIANKLRSNGSIDRLDIPLHPRPCSSWSCGLRGPSFF